MAQIVEKGGRACCGRESIRVDVSCSKGDALAILDVRHREYTESGLDCGNLEKLRDHVAETY